MITIFLLYCCEYIIDGVYNQVSQTQMEMVYELKEKLDDYTNN